MHGMIELPVAGIHDRGDHIRPAQICALSSREMQAGLSHAAALDHAAFVIVTHSFEMLTRDRQRGNFAMMRRFESMCEAIARNPNLHTSGFRGLDPAIADRPGTDQSRAEPSRIRTALRMAEQALATWRYERQWLPV